MLLDFCLRILYTRRSHEAREHAKKFCVVEARFRSAVLLLHPTMRRVRATDAFPGTAHRSTWAALSAWSSVCSKKFFHCGEMRCGEVRRRCSISQRFNMLLRRPTSPIAVTECLRRLLNCASFLEMFPTLFQMCFGVTCPSSPTEGMCASTFVPSMPSHQNALCGNLFVSFHVSFVVKKYLMPLLSNICGNAQL